MRRRPSAAHSRLAALLALPLAVLLAGCGSDSGDASGPGPDSTAVPTDAPSVDDAPSDAVPEPCPVADAADKPPNGRKPAAPAPTRLVVEDLRPGTGAVAAADKRLCLQYLGYLYATGATFDSSWDRGGEALEVAPGTGLIPGFTQGIKGMRVGGRRMVTIPPALGYGAGGEGGIPPNSTLVFVVDLTKVG